MVAQHDTVLQDTAVLATLQQFDGLPVRKPEDWHAPGLDARFGPRLERGAGQCFGRYWVVAPAGQPDDASSLVACGFLGRKAYSFG